MNNGKICVSVCAETVDEMLTKIKLAEPLADVVEVRFDCLDENELSILQARAPGTLGPANKIIDSTDLPIISTFRPREQGGMRDLTFDDRETFWTSGFETEYCDVEEAEFVDHSWSWIWRKRIYSYHDFAGVPANLEEILDRLASTDADILKIAAYAHDAVDGIPIWNLLKRVESYKINRPRLIPIAMGEAGKWTRILGLAHGTYLTYASLEKGSETAEGQVSAKDLREVYRARELDLETRVYGVIGNPVSSSRSPYFQNAAFVESGMNAVFLPFQVKNLGEFIRRMVAPATREVELNFAGFAVTMPHKLAIIPYLHHLDETARAVGAVNTVKIVDGRLEGYNTDVQGFIEPLKDCLVELRGCSAAVIGAGGAARACVYALKREGADVTVFARDERKAATLAEEFGAKGQSFDDFWSDEQDFDALVNATPIGMDSRGGSLFGRDQDVASQISKFKLIYDLVTSREDTDLIRDAKLAGVETISGIEMLLAQGAAQFEIWTGREAPRRAMAEALVKQ
jgi:3-dehydroquinate dehydratase / shikimate dehydrogenase